MTQKVRNTSSRKTDFVTRVGQRESVSGREVWRVDSGGETRTVVTSGSSTAAMDSAMRKYGEALKRLADR